MNTPVIPKKSVSYWLLLNAFLIFIIVGVGGTTRLTQSGLSIVDWDPLMGVLPPLTEKQWQESFARYQQFPEFHKKHFWMELSDYKKIFFWEYIHRLLARKVGLVFFIPLLYFWVRQQIPNWLKWRGTFIFALGGAQGLMGWMMVKSGLVDNPFVSHYRLTAHLGLALLVFSLIVWTYLDYVSEGKNQERSKAKLLGQPFRWIPLCFLILVSLQILYGGLVAGLKAGWAYNTFPLMAGQWIPNSLMYLQPWYLNFFDNMTTVQFIHRSLAWTIFFSISIIFIWSRLKGKGIFSSSTLLGLLILVFIQFILGVLTLIYHVPVTLGVLHQLMAVLLLAVSLRWLHENLLSPVGSKP